MDDAAALEELERWIASNGGFTDPRVTLSWGPRGRGIFATENLGVAAVLCRLPWKLLISEELAEGKLAFGKDLRMAAEELTAAPGLLLLSAFLLQETRSETSEPRFHGPYYRVLPTRTGLPQAPALPACWPEHHWLHVGIKGSHLERQVRAKRHSLGLEFALLQSYMLGVTWEVATCLPDPSFQLEVANLGVQQDFLWARCTVSSRAYALQGQRCLVPWADLLNHGASKEVSARYQLHEADLGREAFGDFIMILTQDVVKGHEVLQTYGEKTNSALLLDYGFVLPTPAAPASVSVVIPLPQIPDTDSEETKASKKQLWLSSGGRSREMVMELTKQNFQKHLELQRAASVCNRSGLSDTKDPVIEIEARQSCVTIAERSLKRWDATWEDTEKLRADWELVAKQACSQVLEEEKCVLTDFLFWVQSLHEVDGL